MEEGKVTVPGREARENLETLGNTLARMVTEALNDLKSGRRQRQDT